MKKVALLILVVCLFASLVVFLLRSNGTDTDVNETHLFPDYLKPAYAYLIIDNSETIIMYHKNYADFGEQGFLEGVIDAYYQSYGGIECADLYKVRLGGEIPEGFDSESLAQILECEINSCQDELACTTIIGLSQFDRVDSCGNIYGSTELYRIDLFSEKWFVSSDDHIVFMANKGSNILKTIVTGWQTQDPDGGVMTYLDSYNIVN